MKKGRDISSQFRDLYLVHQNLPGKRTSALSYPEHILFIPLQGEVSISFENTRVACGLGQMLFLPPEIRHSFSSSDEFGERLIAMISKKVLPPDELPVKPSILPLNQFIKEMLFYLLLHPKTKSASALVSVFTETLRESINELDKSYFLPMDHIETKTLDSRIRQSLHFMRANLSECLNMKDIASQSGLSLRNFNRLFMKEMGLQPKKCLTNYRIEKAKELLKVPGCSVTEAAFAVGYSSLGQFISAFRARTGQLPSEFLRHG